jgi:hypothetical protein
VLREGPVPVLVHGAVEYVVAVLLIAAPFLLDFEHGSATAASIVLGLALLAVTATSKLPTGLTKTLSVGLHVGIDVVFALLLVAVPFVFRFQDETPPTVLFIALGVFHLLLTIATRFPRGRGAAESGSARRVR